MQVQFWGVRGSVPVSGPSTGRTGGSTSCVSIKTRKAIIVLDAGTGIVPLGASLTADDRPIALLLTHPHWDHIQGFPFFDPLYDESRRITLVGPPEWLDAMIGQLDGARFPVDASVLKAQLKRVDQVSDLHVPGVHLQTIAANHPGGCLGFRIEQDGRTVVYLTDNELSADGPTSRAAFVAFCRGADLLVHDAQYSASEMIDRFGWGHSTGAQALALAQDAGVPTVALFHHDPFRTDDALDAIISTLQEKAGHSVRVIAAAEGLALTL